MNLIRNMRWMVQRDFAAVMEIEQLCYAAPWSESDLGKCLRQEKTIGKVHETNGEIDGFIFYTMEKTHIEIENIAVHPSCWCRGVGREMIGNLRGKLSNERRYFLQTLVRESNLAAQLFFRSVGFAFSHAIKDAYCDAQDDGYLFRLFLDCPAAAILQTQMKRSLR